MAKYAFPAVFHQEGELYSVSFPDVSGCFTSGNSLPDAMGMAEDALCLMLCDFEESGKTIPSPSDIKRLQSETDDLVSLVFCDTVEYKKLYSNQAVKKTLSIPAWLNTLSKREGLNFSQVLQEGLKARLQIN